MNILLKTLILYFILDKDINYLNLYLRFLFIWRVFLFKIQKNQVPDDSTPVNRREFVLRLLSTPTNKELRCQVNIKAILVI